MTIVWQEVHGLGWWDFPAIPGGEMGYIVKKIGVKVEDEVVAVDV